MPSRKGKGRQSLGFGSKSQKAQFHQEWQTRVQEDYYQQKRKEQRRLRRQQQRLEGSNIRTNIRFSTSAGSGGGASTTRRPKTASLQSSNSTLRRLIAERQYWDRLEDRSWIYGGQQQQQKRLAASANDPTLQSFRFQDISPPGWLLYYDDETNHHCTDSYAVDEYRRLINNNSSNNRRGDDDDDDDLSSQKIPPKLQSLAIQTLAKALPDYLEELGMEQLHNYLALLPPESLTLLSVLTCQLGNMTTQLCQVLGKHSHITRFSLVAPISSCHGDDAAGGSANSSKHCVVEETDPNWKELQPNIALRETFLPPSALLSKRQQSTASSMTLSNEDDDAPSRIQHQQYQHPLWVSNHAVPDSWEDLLDGEDSDDDANDDDLLLIDAHQRPQQQHTIHSLSSSLPPHRFGGGGGGGGCIIPQQQQQSLERLELGNLPLLEVEVVRDVLLTSGCCGQTLTHLGLSGSLLYYDNGPDVLWQLSNWVPNLRVLDVSGNTTWITEPVLRSVYESYFALWESQNQNQNHNNNSNNSRKSLLFSKNNNEQEKLEEEEDSSSDNNTAATTTTTTTVTSTNNDNMSSRRASSSAGSTGSSSTTTTSSYSVGSHNHDGDDDDDDDDGQRRLLAPHQHHRHQHLLIKATGCLSRSSQILMEMEFGTLF